MALPLTDPTRSTLLRLSGHDALDVLHRISTQSLLDLEPAHARATLFCDFRGRLLHRAIVARAGDAVWLLRDDAPADALRAYVDRHVFREDVRIDDQPGTLEAVVCVLSAELAPGEVHERDGVPLQVQLEDGFALAIADAAAGLEPAGELDRIQAGRPRHGHEIADTFNPFEVGLARDVHLSKGCYTGQEVLLRLMSYQSVRRQLVRLRGAGAAPAVPATIATPDTTSAASDAATHGMLTSAAPDPDGGWVGLAVMTRAPIESGHPLSVGGATARIEHVFASERPPGLP